MGNLFSGTEADEGTESQSTPVVVNVYDLTPLNNYTYILGLGIFHSGVEGAMCSCLLPESLQVTSAKQLPECHACSEDGSECLSGNTLHGPTESDDTDHERHLLSSSAAGE